MKGSDPDLMNRQPPRCGTYHGRRCPVAGLAAVLCLAAALAHGGAPDGSAKTSPDFAAPSANALLPPGGDPGPLRLLGIDLLQDGAPLTGDTPAVDANKPLEIVAYWVPYVRLPARLPLSARFWAHRFMVSGGDTLEAGPEAGAPPWEAGGVYRQPHTVNLPAVLVSVSGEARLLIGLESVQRDKGRKTLPLMDLAVTVAPRVGGGKIPRKLLEARAPGGMVLSKSFRLCRGASVVLPVTPSVGGRVVSVLVCSAFSYGDVPQDKPVFEMVPQTAGGAAMAAVPVLSGAHTARTDYDFYPARSMGHGKAEIIDSQEADTTDSGGLPMRRHRYAAQFDLPAPAALTGLAFRPVSNVVVDVFDVVLLLEAPAPEPSGPPPAAEPPQ